MMTVVTGIGSHVAMAADRDPARTEKVTAVLIEDCRTVLVERCYITSNESLTTADGT
jgi:hypothetical protein